MYKKNIPLDETSRVRVIHRCGLYTGNYGTRGAPHCDVAFGSAN